MTLVIKKIDEKKLREFKAEAIRRGLTLSQAIEEAIELWLRRPALLTEEDVNNLVYVRMKRQLEKYKGKYVVIARGKFLGAFDTLKDAGLALRKLDELPKHAIIVKVGVDKAIEGELEWLGGSIEFQRV